MVTHCVIPLNSWRGNLTMQVNLNIKKWFSFFTFNHVYSFLFGMLGAMLIVLIANTIHPNQKEIATVNIHQIIRQFSQTEAKKDIAEEALRNETRTFSKNIEETLKEFWRKHNLILVPTEAVIAGCHDYTAVITQEMMEKR